MTPGRALPVVAVVGRPNVGKSSLVNRFLGRREAIVEAMPGVTRDRSSFVTEWRGRTFEVVDTGGLEPGAKGLEARAAEQAELALEAADVVVLVVDAATGPMEDDLVVADLLRKSGKPVVVAANKVDDERGEPAAASFYRLGLGDPVVVSALHGRGSGDLLDAVATLLPEALDTPRDAWASLAIVGRPNVGKSSLLNALIGEHRALVDERPGTTRDPVDSYVAPAPDRVVRIVDTAGMRRQVQIKDPIEYFAWLRARRTLARVDATLLVVDAAEGVTAADQRLLDEVVSAGRACVIVANKWDLVAGELAAQTRATITERLHFAAWARVVTASALSGRGTTRILESIVEAVESHRRRLPTAEVNRIVRDAQAHTPHPRVGARAVRVLYAVQADVAPPRFLMFTNGGMEQSYMRFLERTVREREPFVGTPLVVEARARPRAKVDA